MDDIEIIRRAQSGDENAYEAIYKAYYKIAYFYALKICLNDSDAQDVAQDAMIDVRRYLPSLRNENYFRPWLYQIVAHRCSKMFRKEKHVRNNGEVAGGMGALIKEERQDYNPESLMRFQSDKDVLLYFIDKLPTQQRNVIVLFYLEQFSIKEIAEIMKTPQGTVKSRMATARKTLYEALKSYQKQNEEPLSFKALDTLLFATMAAAFQSLHIPVSSVSAPQKVRSSHSFQNTFLAKAALIVCVSVVGVTGITFANHYFEQKEDKPTSLLEQSETVKFPIVKYQNQTITSARDAYFVLLKFACCEEEFNLKSKEEVDAIQPVYEAYKQAQVGNKALNMNVSWETSFSK